jgi:hypothetical protein
VELLKFKRGGLALADSISIFKFKRRSFRDSGFAEGLKKLAAKCFQSSFILFEHFKAFFILNIEEEKNQTFNIA